ncbi:MAG: SDR family oxidoreductase [Casimicrobiaceae bacterium]
MNVFLTGASSGLGAALAAEYAGRGANLGLFSRRADALARVAAALPRDRVAIYAGDVADATALAAAAADFMARYGTPDVVIANAGVSRGADTAHGEDLPVFHQVFATNMLGMVHTFAPFVRAMRTARRGTLVGIASIAGFRGLPGGGAYSASKAAAINYLESLRVEMRGTGVAVVTICPGYIATPMTAENPYRMPFLMPPARAARLTARAIARRRPWYVLPWQMAMVGWVVGHLPRPVFDAVFARAPRKPRGDPAP